MNTHEERYVDAKRGLQELFDDLEDLESMRAFDRAKAFGEKPIPFEQAVSEIEHRQT
jgi:hypothetical protein